MEQLFEDYQKCIFNLVALTSSENHSQIDISQEERNKVAEIENQYMNTVSDLKQIKQTLYRQYRNVRESCASNAGLRSPEDQRPAYTTASVQECVRIQEQVAKEIQEWLERKKQQAMAERQKELQREEAMKRANALSAAEAERKRKEEAEALEAQKGATLLEEMKRKFRNK